MCILPSLYSEVVNDNFKQNEKSTTVDKTSKATNKNFMGNRIVFQIYYYHSGGARGVMVIVEGTGHGDTSSNPGRD